MESFVLFFATNGNRRRWFAVLAVLAGLVLMSCSGGGGNRGSEDGSGGDPTYSAWGNSAPVADAGADQNVKTGTLVLLDGSGSYDADKDPLSYSWEFVSVPPGSTAVLLDSTTVNPTFLVDLDGSYLVRLTINDGFNPDQIDEVTIVAATLNSAPVANAGANQNVVIGTVVSLDGSGSYDADEDQLAYLWKFTSIPSGSFAALSDPGIVNPTFTPDQYGSYLIELMVNDGYVNSAGDVITVNVYSDYALYFSSESSGFTISSLGYFWPDSYFGLTISNHANIPFRCYRAELLNGGSVIGSTEDPQYLGGEQIEPGEDVGVTFKLTSYFKNDGLEIRYYLLRPDTGERFTVSKAIEPPND